MAQQLGAEPPEPHDPPLARGRGRIFSGPADVAYWCCGRLLHRHV